MLFFFLLGSEGRGGGGGGVVLGVSKDQPIRFFIGCCFLVLHNLLYVLQLTKETKLFSLCPVNILTGVSISLFPLFSHSCNSEHGNS